MTNDLPPSGRELLNKLESRQAVCAVVGLGYVGLPLLMEIGEAGLQGLGFDVDADRVARVNAGESHVEDVSEARLGALLQKDRVRATADGADLARADTVSICVPTPLRKSKDPDISFIVDATRLVREHLHPGMLVVLESTTYPGTTEEVILPELQESGLEVGRDFYLAFSPERVDPGNTSFHTRNTPKVVGGLTPACRHLARALYECLVDQVVPVSSPAAAEMVKLLENTFRSVNIGLVNEVAIMCQKLGCDVWEVIEAAATKPFGFMPFFPGPGLGGHCIPIDPHYLSWKLKTLNYNARFIELAGQINSEMPEHVVALCVEALNRVKKPVNGSEILMLGVAYKRDVGDCRESPALDILELLRRRGASVAYCDPHVESLSLDGATLQSRPFDAGTLAAADLVVVATDHAAFEAETVARHARLVVDTRNFLKRHRDPERIYTL